jgi:hypothetical protein
MISSSLKISSEANVTHFVLSLKKFEPDVVKICTHVNEALNFQCLIKILPNL